MHHLSVAALLCLSVAAQSPTPADPVDVPTWAGSTVADWNSAAAKAADLLESGLDGEIGLRQAVDSAIESLGVARTADRLRALVKEERSRAA